MSSRRDGVGPPVWIAGLAGLLSAALGLGTAELVAGLGASLRSPVLDVGDRVVDRVPGALKDVAIDWFGTGDKAALLTGIGIVLGLYAVAVGIVALRWHPGVGLGMVALFAAAGSAAALADRAGASIGAVLPTVVGSAVVAATLLAFDRVLKPGERELDRSIAALVPSPRRRFLAAAGVAVLGAAATAAAGRRLERRFSAASSRRDVALPPPGEPPPSVPSAAQAGGAAPFITPNRDFYRIDTALTVPQVPAETWTLRVHGMVDRQVELTYEDLLDRPLIEQDITLTCVSNTVGGGLVGNARWLGSRLDDLLAEAGIDPDADQVVGRSVDGYTCGFPVGALDGRDALVAVGMNGVPLPLEHGFPARLVVPGLYGYVSATKWLSEIELTTFDAFDHYWVPRGYAAEAPIKLQSRIDTPRGLQRIAPGPFAVAGVAWAQTVGIDAVEVRIDDGDWQRADLAAEVNDVTWRQWSYRWDATPGRHSIAVRAIDRNGAMQTAERSEPLPDGATGHHTVVALVDEV